MVDVSLWTSLSTESHPNLCNNGAADESKGLPVTILAALFCNFRKVFIRYVMWDLKSICKNILVVTGG